MKFTFSTPDEYLAWVEAQHESLQVRIIDTTNRLMDMGLHVQVAAEMVYQIIRKSALFISGPTTKH